MAKSSSRMRNRGLLTKHDREVLLGDGFSEEEREERLPDIRWKVRERMDNISEDLEILREADEEELVGKFYNNFGRSAQLERRIDELEQELEDQSEHANDNS